MKKEKNKIKFSCLMSVYKKEKVENLKLAIESILNQTLLPNEFIIIKDGPLTKELDDCLEEYKNNQIIKIIELKKNVGLGKALNEGIKYCAYEYIARMDSDDISIKDRFEKQIEYIEKNRDCDLIGGNIMEFDDITGNDISLRKVPTNLIEIKKYAKKRNPVNHVTVIFKKKSIVEVGNYQDCPYFEDYFLWIRMLIKNKKIINIDDVLVRVRAGMSMSDRRGNLQYIKHIINFEKKIYDLKYIGLINFLSNVTLRSVVV